MSIFSNRELAVAIWLIVLFILSLLKENIRQSYQKVLKSFFNFKILIYILVSVVYFLIIIMLINCKYRLDLSQLKDAIIWFIASGLVLTANTFSSKSTKNIIENLIINNLKLIVLLEYIIATYTFSFFVEIFSFPIILFIVLMSAVSQTDEKYISVYKIFNGLQIFIGLLIICFSIYSAVLDYKGLIGKTSLVNILLPILYMILYFPVSYLWILYVKYEELFCVITQLFKNKKNIELGGKLKYEIFKYCKFRYNRINDIRSNKYYYWHLIKTEKQISEFIYYNRNKIVKNIEDQDF